MDSVLNNLNPVLQMLLVMSVFSLLPFFFTCMTCFLRYAIVLSMLKQALGTQQVPPAIVLLGLCIILTIYTMNPVFSKMWEMGSVPYQKNGDIVAAMAEGSKPLKEFMIANAEKYGIVPRWGDQKLSMENTFTHHKLFGSYMFESNKWGDEFELSNARNSFRFYVDCTNKKFIVQEYSNYKLHKYLGERKYNHTSQKSTYDPIANYDKFATWLWQIVDDFNASK